LEVDHESHAFTASFLAVGNCQNGDISKDKDNGLEVTPELLAKMMWELRAEGCHNVNLVGGEPTVHLHTIVEAISLLGKVRPTPRDLQYMWLMKPDYLRWRRLPEERYTVDGQFNVPILWNSNMFMSGETLEILRELVDIWLPDFKFGNNKCAIRLARTPWYWETVTENHRRIYEWGEDIVVRHLVMPNHVECCTKPVLRWIAENMPGTLVNVMDQYHPDCFADPRSPEFDPRLSDIARYPTREEIEEAYRFAAELGIPYEVISLEKKGFFPVF
jgi:putative pyruvate formate lyase activating enzyme